MAVVHMMRSEDREGDFPTECGAVGNVRLSGDWAEVTCNNCIRKFGPKDAKDTYKEQAKEKRVKVQVSYTPEEKKEDSERMSLEGLLNGVRSQQLRLEGTKISVMAMLDAVSLVDEEAIAEMVACSEYLDAALSNLRIVKGMVFTALHGSKEE